MKYCSKCGAELHDEAVICPSCGCDQEVKEVPQNNRGLLKVALAFMIVTCVFCVLRIFIYDGEPSLYVAYIIGCLIPLVWSIPMTISLGLKIKRGNRIGTGFKVCTLIFVNIIAGILLLCCKEK